MGDQISGKRKSPRSDFFDEVNELDLSPENSDVEMMEPSPKVFKCDGVSIADALTARSNEGALNEKMEHREASVASRESELGTISTDVKVTNPLELSSMNIELGSPSSLDGAVSSQCKQTDAVEPASASENTELGEPSSSENTEFGSLIVVDEINPSDFKTTDTVEPASKKSKRSHNLVDEVVPVTFKGTKSENQDTECNSLNVAEVFPSIVIQFYDERISDIYKSKFLKFLATFVELTTVQSPDGLKMVCERDENINSSEWVVIDSLSIPEADLPAPAVEISGAHSPKKRKKKSKNKKEKDQPCWDELFVLDTNPSNPGEMSVRYSSKFVLNEKEEEVKEKEVRVITQSCFNCNESHSLRDCPNPKDFTKIRLARQVYNMKQPPKYSRYHLEEDQMYSHIKPGVISENLRKALGLRSHELPPYIYKMRILGYPPGWLEEAKSVHSNLDMFDSEGKHIQQRKLKQSLDPTKIVEYPGFNVPPKKGDMDDYKHFDVPPYSKVYSKEAMLEYFEKEFAKQEDNLEACDMEVDDDLDQLASNSNSNGPLIEGSYDLPSLTDLEQKKKDLLAQLNQDTSSDPGTPQTQEETVIAKEESIKKIAQEIEEVEPVNLESNPDETIIDLTNSNDDVSCVTPKINKSSTSVLQSSFGTPILKSSSPYSRLPDPERFTKDVSPVINFENLPNSTGKYEQMTGILQSVRNKLKCLQEKSPSKT